VLDSPAEMGTLHQITEGYMSTSDKKHDWLSQALGWL